MEPRCREVAGDLAIGPVVLREMGQRDAEVRPRDVGQQDFMALDMRPVRRGQRRRRRTTGGSAPMMAGFAAVAPVSSISQPKVSLSKTSIWAVAVASE